MKKSKFITVIILLVSISVSKAQSWQWARLISDTGDVSYCNITVLKNGDNISIGSFMGKTNASATHTLLSNGGYDICLVKRNSAGTVLWAKRFGGTANDYGHSICLDKLGNIIIGGRFNQTMTFGSTLLTANGGDDIILAKLDPDGNPIWANSYGGSSSGPGIVEGIYGLCTDSLNNIYSTGNFYGYLLDFGGGNIISSGGVCSDIFIMKSDSLGTTKWVKSGKAYSGGFDYCEGTSIAISRDNNTLVAGGYYRGPNFVYGTDTLINPDVSTNDSYFVSINPQNGSRNFISQISGNNGYTQVRALAFDKSNNILMCGNSPSKNFITPFTQTTTKPGPFNIFVFKFNISGNLIWSTAMGNSTYAHAANEIKVGKNNSIYVAGSYNNYVESGPFYVVNNGGFLAKLDSNKNTISLSSINNTMGTDWGFRNIGIDSSDNVYTHGLIRGNFTLSPNTYTVTKTDYLTAKFGNPNSIVTGIEDKNLNPVSLNIFPNPTNEVCHIKSVEIIKSIIITDLNGKLIFEKKKINSKSFTLNTTDFNNGLYTIEITNENSSSFQKLIVENSK